MPVFQTPLTGLRFPEPVFLSHYGGFRFLEFDSFPSPEFWTLLSRLATLSGDPAVTVTFIEPADLAPLSVAVSASAHNYFEALGDSADLAEILFWTSASQQWVICAERIPELLVFAGVAGFAFLASRAFQESGVSAFDVNDALDISSNVWRTRAARLQFAERFAQNYGEGLAFEDRTQARVLTAAVKLVNGEAGVIETSRAMMAWASEFDPPSRQLFEVFAGIASESDELPVGEVRKEWDAQALARADLQIAQLEEFYRASALEACRGLIRHFENRG